MYPVSDAYINAIENTNHEWAVSVILYNFYNFPEETFWAYGGDMRDGQIMNGITIESQMVSGGANENMIDIGAVPAKKMTLTLIDENSDLHKYANRRLAVYVYITIETEQGEKIQQQIPMGVFYVDSGSLSRNGNQISIVAYDSMLSFQYALTEEQRASLKGRYATEAASFLASYSDCGFDQDLSALPNGNIPLNFDSAQVVTGRDALMWIAQIMGCFARIDRHNNLEFVPIKCDWTYFDEEQTLGTINAVRNIQGAQRYDELKFTDDRIHIVGVAMEREDGKLVTRGFEGLFDDANITITLEKNPIISGCGKSLESILDAILEQLCTVYFYAFKTVIRNDPSLDAGDVIRLQGGVINGTNRNNDLIGFITHSTWHYHGRQTITNVGQVPIVYRDAPIAAVAALSDDDGITPLARTRAADAGFQVAPVPQSQKATKGGAATSLVFAQASQYNLRFTNPYIIEATDGYTTLASIRWDAGAHFSVETKDNIFDINQNTIKIGFNNGSSITLGQNYLSVSIGGNSNALTLSGDNNGGFILQVGGHTVKTS